MPGPIAIAEALWGTTVQIGQSITTPGVTDAPGLEAWAEMQNEPIDWHEAAAAGLLPPALVEELEAQEARGEFAAVVLTADQRRLLELWRSRTERSKLGADDSTAVVAAVVVAGGLTLGTAALAALYFATRK